MIPPRYRHRTIILGLLALATSPGTFASSPPLALPPVTVTADKVARDLDDVAGNVLSIDADVLRQQGVNTIEQLEARVPGLAFQPFGQSGVHSPVLRGLTANFNSFATSTLLLVDGVPTLTAQGFDNRLLDLERIEVLRGPQSTLYGRNAEAGVIALHSRPLTNQPRSRLSLAAGDRHQQQARVVLARPLVDNTLFAGISGEWQRQDGFIDNTLRGDEADDRQRHNLNVSLRWLPTDTTDLVLRHSRQRYDDGAALWGPGQVSARAVASDSPGWNRSHGETWALDLHQELAPGLQLRSISAYNDYRDKVRQDTDFQPPERMLIGRDHHLRLWSQELRLQGQSGTADWLAGLYGDWQDNALDNLAVTPMASQRQQADQSQRTLALFGHWQQAIAERWALAAGARLEQQQARVHFATGQRQQDQWLHLSPKLSLQYRLQPDHQLYSSVSHGVRAGGFNTISPGVGPAAFEPEQVWSYELGAKGRFHQQRGRYALAVYHMTVDDMQVMQMPVPGRMYLTNAASGSGQGLELDLEYRLSHHWSLQGGLAWNHLRFDRFRDGEARYDGHRNPFAPDLNGHLGLGFDHPTGWHGQLQWLASSKTYLDAANQYRRSGYGRLDLSAGYRFGDWSLDLQVDNLSDQRYDAVGYQNGFVTVYSPPRSWRLALTWQP